MCHFDVRLQSELTSHVAPPGADEENEFYYDHERSLLYLSPNGTSAAPADGELVAVRGKVILSVTGTQAQPVRDVSLRGLTFRDAAPTFLDAHDLPSEGDW